MPGVAGSCGGGGGGFFFASGAPPVEQAATSSNAKAFTAELYHALPGLALRGVLDAPALRVVEHAAHVDPRQDARLADRRFLLRDRVDRAGDVGVARVGAVERVVQRLRRGLERALR